MALATFGAGCFWGIEAAFQHIDGVTATEVGYAGGSVQNPSYEQVCTDETGHAEVVRLEYDPDAISYGDLLEVFWGAHNPTTMNRQGADFGAQYRSVIFYHDAAQQSQAGASKAAADASGRFGSPIVTIIEAASSYFAAEDYHQKYFEKRGEAACHI